MVDREALCSLRVVGFHAWPDAPERREYLRHRHRHEFHITAAVTAMHNDREVEIHDLRDHVAGVGTFSALREGWEHAYEYGTRSCEDIAEEIAEAVAAAWPGRRVTVTVLEDGEAGGRVTLHPGDTA